MDVRLPNGTVIRGIPEGTSKEEIQAKAIAKGLATEADFIAPKQDTGFSLEGAIEDIAPGFLKSAERIAPALKEAAPEPSTVGGVGGAILGGMVGGIPGSIAGGSLGSGAGQLIEEAMKPGEMTAENYLNAATEAAVSLGLDVVTLGAGKVAGPALRQAGGALERFSPQFKQLMENYRLAGVPPEQAVKDVAEVGSDEAFKRSQQFLSERGASLTPGQFPNATKAEQIKEAIGRSGFVSGRNFDQNMSNINQAVNDEFNKLFNFKQADDVSGLGSNTLQIIEAGKKQLGTTYRQGLDEVTGQLSKQTVSGKPVANQLKAYLKKFETPVMAEKKVTREVKIPGLKPKTVTEVKQVKDKISSLDDNTVSLIKDAIKTLDNVTTMPADTLITVQKKLMNEIDRLGDFNSGVYNKQASQELAEFSSTYREVVARQLQNVAPEAAARFKTINRAFSEGMGNLLPPINKNFIARATKDDFSGLGKVLTSRYQPDQAKALFNSIRTAYKGLDDEALSALPFKTANEAIDNVRASYVKEIMPTVGDEVINIKDYAKLAKQFQNKNVQAKAKEVLGDKFVPFMDLLNTMNAASKVPESAMPTLFLRAKEYAAAGGLATAYGLGAIEGVTLGASAAAIFGIPEILARAAVNPKHVNRLKVFSKTKFDTAEEAFQRFSIIANDIMAPELEEYKRKAKESLAQ
jgi:hypothetical protein